MKGIVLFVVAMLGRLADGLTTAVPIDVQNNRQQQQQPQLPFVPFEHITQGAPFEPVTGPPAPFEPPVTVQASFSEQQPVDPTAFEPAFNPPSPPFVQGIPVGEQSQTPFGPDCSQFQCSVPTCLDGSMPTVPAGKCCPTCAMPTGAAGTGSVTSEPVTSGPLQGSVKSGPLQCSQVQCVTPVCPEGVMPITLPSECCSTCPEVPPAITTSIGPEIRLQTGNAATENPATGNPATGNPVTGNHVTGNPVTGNPVTGNPASNCDLSQCQMTRCPAGSNLITPAGGCCPQCVTDTTQSNTTMV